MDSGLTDAWRLVGTMSKMSDLALEQEIQVENMLYYADACILIEKIIVTFPELGKAKALALSLVERISIKEATSKANIIIFKNLADILEPQSSGPCFEAYLNLRLTNPNLNIAKETTLKEYDRKEWETGQEP